MNPPGLQDNRGDLAEVYLLSEAVARIYLQAGLLLCGSFGQLADLSARDAIKLFILKGLLICFNCYLESVNAACRSLLNLELASFYLFFGCWLFKKNLFVFILICKPSRVSL